MPRPFQCRVSLDWTEPYARDALAGIVEVARAKGWTLVGPSWPGEATITDDPALAADRGPLAVGVSTRDTADVYADRTTAARLAVEHLLGRGFRHLARFELTHGAAAFDAAVMAAGHATGRVVDLLANLADLPRPLGVVAADDLGGVLVLDRARAAGLRVPDDVTVVGFGNDPVICELAGVPLTSIDPNARAIGRRAALRVDRLRRGRPAGPPEAVPCGRLVVRTSSDTLAVADADVAAALRLVQDAAGVAVRVVDLVRASGLDRRTLERRLRAALGRSPAEVIRRHRAARAADLLRSTALPVTTIARQTGFRLPQHLAVTLKAIYGQTPTDLRAASL